MMIPFMGAQSLVIGKMFGEGFQYGKRKISAMPNEEFNKLTFEIMMSNARDEMQASIPTMIQAMQDMKPMVQAVIHEFTNYLSLVIQAAPEQAEQIVSEVAHGIAPHAEPQIPAGHTEELNIFETIAEQFPHLHEAGATDIQQKVKVPLVGSAYYREHKEHGHPSGHIVPKFDAGNLKPQVPRTFETRKANQSAIMERKRLIQQISDVGKALRAGSPSGNAQAKRNTRIAREGQLRQLQQKLINLQTRYRFD